MRSGLVNIYKYDEQEFRFERGRLLLRGLNGTGKSRVLAMQLPFLLDGELAAHRVEPDGDSAKRVEWNLLMDKEENRLGYTWIEFGRVDEDGGHHFLTLGCGLHARKGAGIASKWFFVTEMRVGGKLRLVSEDGFPLNRERLAAAVGVDNVFRTAREHRAAVDRALFRLGDRYEPLLDLLIQLRKPQIMRDFREDDLSRLLGNALPPLAPALVETIAVSLRALESDREQLEDFALALRGVEEFSRDYLGYVRVAVKRRADEVRGAHSAFEAVQRELARLGGEIEETAAGIARESAARRTAAENLSAAETRERTLLDSPEMKGVETLRDAERQSREQADFHERAISEAAGARQVADEAEVRRGTSADRLAKRGETLAEARNAADRRAVDVDFPKFPEPADESARREFEAAAARRADAIRQVESRNRVLEETRRREREARRIHDDRGGEVARLREEEIAAGEARAAALADLAAGIYRWEEGLAELRPSGGTDWEAAFADWLEERSGTTPLEAEIEAARRRGEDSLNEEINSERRRRETHAAELAVVAAELESLREGGHPAPVVNFPRSAGNRAALAGAPLWKICDFREEVGADKRAGYEAALEAAGLLDAWITPDGQALDAATGEAVFSPAHETAGGLNAVISATPGDSGVPEEIVRRVLAGIGARSGEGANWVAESGRWQHGRLAGVWKKAEAEFIGHAAREAARARRIAELEAETARISALLAEIGAALDRLAARLELLRDEAAGAPPVADLREAAAALDAAAAATRRARVRLEEADRALAAARETARLATEERDRDAADLGLGGWKEKTPELRERMAELNNAAAALWPAWERAGEARADLAADERLASDAAGRAAGAAERESGVARLAGEAWARFETLRETIGAGADEVLARLASARTAVAEFKKEGHALAASLQKLEVAEAVLAEKSATAGAEREVRGTARDEAVRALLSLAEKRLIEEAAPALQPEDAKISTTGAVRLARDLDQELGAVDAADEAWRRFQSGIHAQFSSLQNELAMRGYHPAAEVLGDGVFVVTCDFQGRPRTMRELAASLAGEIASRREMLTAKEREVIENHLIGEAATELQRRIRAGEDWVREANEEMAAHPTSSGIKLRFRWEVDPDAPPELETARRQLLKMTAAWSPVEREAMGNFLQSRIEAARRADEGASLQEHLTRALDYRKWHRFAVERHQDGTWKRLTKKTYGTGSGGEKALMLTMPQFAAAAAHYRSAGPHAPRLILLDEVFVGIDSPTRAGLMELLVNFDLDFVMTSEREWGCYPTLPDLAICQLTSHPQVDAVAVTRWVWNGRDRVEAAE